jgi:hypothetical protein
MEAFLMQTEKAQEIAKCLPKEIIPQFGIPVSIGPDNGPDFVDEVVQLVTKGLGITWKLHMAYCPQSSGKVECMTRTLKLLLGNYVRRPIALLRIRSSPMKQTGVLPFEVLYGHPPPTNQVYMRGPQRNR